MSDNPKSANAPAFDFYPERWSQGTRHMTKAERCDYLDLLCFQWSNDGLPADLEVVARIIGYRRTAQIPAAVLEKFPVSSDGKRRNARLEIIRKEQRERITARQVGAAIAHAKVNGVESLSTQEHALLISAGRLMDGVLVNGKPVAGKVAGKAAGKVASRDAGSLPPPTPHPPPHPDSSSPSPPPARPRLEQARTAAEFLGVTVQEAEDWWHAREASEWMKGTAGGGTTPVGVNWSADLKTFTSRVRERKAGDAARGKRAAAPRTQAGAYTDEIPQL